MGRDVAGRWAMCGEDDEGKGGEEERGEERGP